MQLCRLLSKWQNISTVILKKKKTDDAALQKNAKILEKGLVQTKRFFSKECEEVLWRFSQKLVVALRGSIMAKQLA